jgi:hypothetical protein
MANTPALRLPLEYERQCHRPLRAAHRIGRGVTGFDLQHIVLLAGDCL